MIQQLLFPEVQHQTEQPFDPTKTKLTVADLIANHKVLETKQFFDENNIFQDLTKSTTKAFKRSNQAKRDAQAKAKESLKGWNGMRKRELTKELENEFTILRLKKYLASVSFAKDNDFKRAPEYFEIGHEIDDGLGRKMRRKNKMGTMFDQLMRMDDENGFTKRKFREIQIDKSKRVKNRRYRKLRRQVMKGQKKLKLDFNKM
jgi:hypothetical protein